MINNEIVCHTGIIQFPMRKNWKRVHRLVVLPDYQGIGIGTTFINEIAKLITSRGNDLNLTTTTPSLVYALKKKPQWKLVRYGRSKGNWSKFNVYGLQNKHLANAISNRRITYSFDYKKDT